MKSLFALWIALCACAVSLARAEIIVRQDGRVFAAEIVSQDASEMILMPEGAKQGEVQRVRRDAILEVILTDKDGKVLSRAAAATEPAAGWQPPPAPQAPPLEASVPAGPRYYVIPLRGDVGVEILARTLEQSLADALTRKPDVVVLEIDSPGGLISEAVAIIDVLHRYNNKLRIVAWVGRDLSAAAIFSLSVREIYVKPMATIGAATAYRHDNPWLPPKIDEKMQSAWRAVGRSSAQEGGHDPLLAEAMIEGDVDLHLEDADGRTVVRKGPGPRQLNAKGRILTLTAQEAIGCGLAAGRADDYDELGKALNLAGWTECTGLGRLLGDYTPRQIAAMTAELLRLRELFLGNFAEASKANPAVRSEGSLVTVPKVIDPGEPDRTFAIRSPGQMPGQTYNPLVGDGGVRQVTVPGRAPVIGRETMWVPARPPTVDGTWKVRALRCVVSLQRAEQNMQDAIRVLEVGGQSSAAAVLLEPKEALARLRAKTYAQRNGPLVDASVPVVTPSDIEQAVRFLGDRNLAQQTAAANWLTLAAVDDKRRGDVLAALWPFLDDDDARRHAPFIRAFARWAGENEVRQLTKLLEFPLRYPDGHEPCWEAALRALVRLDPAEAERVVKFRAKQILFKETVESALKDLALGKDEQGKTARHLLELVHPK